MFEFITSEIMYYLNFMQNVFLFSWELAKVLLNRTSQSKTNQMSCDLLENSTICTLKGQIPIMVPQIEKKRLALSLSLGEPNVGSDDRVLHWLLNAAMLS